MVNLKVTVLHNKMWIICDTEEPIVSVIWHGWAIQCFVYVWKALPVRMNRQKHEMIKIYPIGWKCLGIACIPNYNQYICEHLLYAGPNKIVCLYVDAVIYFIIWVGCV